MVDETLRIINSWYIEPSIGGERPKLLSKLALLELCGWLEGEFDSLLLQLESICLEDAEWVKENVLDRTSGFTYVSHLRPMVSKVIGEVFARKIERRNESEFPGELDQMTSMLGSLWKLRCDFAHSDMVANIASQQVFQAPSWVINQHRILKRCIDHFRISIEQELDSIRVQGPGAGSGLAS